MAVHAHHHRHGGMGLGEPTVISAEPALHSTRERQLAVAESTGVQVGGPYYPGGATNGLGGRGLNNTDVLPGEVPVGVAPARYGGPGFGSAYGERIADPPDGPHPRAGTGAYESAYGGGLAPSGAVGEVPGAPRIGAVDCLPHNAGEAYATNGAAVEAAQVAAPVPVEEPPATASVTSRSSGNRRSIIAGKLEQAAGTLTGSHILKARGLDREASVFLCNFTDICMHADFVT